MANSENNQEGERSVGSSSGMDPKDRELAFYDNVVSAFFQTRFEVDKGLLGLSSGGIGLIVTLISTRSVSSPLQGLAFIGAFIAFLATVVLVLVIFRRNGVYLESLTKEREDEDSHTSAKLLMLDTVAGWAFGVGAVLAIVGALAEPSVASAIFGTCS